MVAGPLGRFIAEPISRALIRSYGAAGPITPGDLAGKSLWIDSLDPTLFDTTAGDIDTVRMVDFQDNALTLGQTDPLLKVQYVSGQYVQFDYNGGDFKHLNASANFDVREGFFVVSELIGTGGGDNSNNGILSGGTADHVLLKSLSPNSPISLDGSGTARGYADFNSYEGYYGENVRPRQPEGVDPLPNTGFFIFHFTYQDAATVFDSINRIFGGTWRLHGALCFDVLLSAKNALAMKGWMAHHYSQTALLDPLNPFKNNPAPNLSQMRSIISAGSSVSLGVGSPTFSGWNHQLFTQDKWVLKNPSVGGTTTSYWLANIERINNWPQYSNVILGLAIGNEGEDQAAFINGMRSLLPAINAPDIYVTQNYARTTAGGDQRRYDTNKDMEQDSIIGLYQQFNFMGALSNLADGLIPNLDSGDGVHPNDDGYAMMANAINEATIRNGAFDWSSVPDSLPEQPNHFSKPDAATVNPIVLTSQDTMLSWTIEFGLRMGDTSTDKNVFSTDSTGFACRLFVDADGFLKLTDGTTTIASSISAPQFDTWSRIAIRFHQWRGLDLFVNGNLEGNIDYLSSPLTVSSPTTAVFGGLYDDNSNDAAFVCLRDVVMYRAAQDADRIADSAARSYVTKASQEYYNQFNDITDLSNASQTGSALVVNDPNVVQDSGELVPFDPSLIATDFWVDASDADTITESGGLVSQWDDKSGNDRHLTQGVGDEQPAYTANAVTFDGVNDVMEALGYEPNGELSIYIIATNERADASFGVNAIVCTANTGGDGQPGFAIFNGSQFSPPGSNYQYIIEGQLTSTADEYTNGNPGGQPLTQSVPATLSVITDTNSAAPNVLHVGSFPNGSFWGNTVIHEILIVIGVDSTEARQRMEGYLNWKWDAILGTTQLVDALPVDHPWKSAPPTYLDASCAPSLLLEDGQGNVLNDGSNDLGQ